MSKNSRYSNISKNELQKPEKEDSEKVSKSISPIKIMRTKHTTDSQKSTNNHKDNQKKVTNIRSTTATIKPKVSNQKPEKVTTTSKPTPIRAKHTPMIVKNVKDIQANSKNRVANINKNPIMTKVHNVTVMSPPLQRKQLSSTNSSELLQKESKSIKDSQKPGGHVRNRTRTLNPEEVLILKKPPINTDSPKSLDTLIDKSKSNDNTTTANQLPKRKPIAFEINFNQNEKINRQQTATIRKQQQQQVPNQHQETTMTTAKKQNEEPVDYEDDFESYESDFETGSSSSPDASSSLEPTSNENDKSQNTEQSDTTEEDTDNCEESEETQLPVTVIHREKDDDRKLDSGNYDMNLRKEMQSQLNQQQQLDSIDTITGYSEQLDSGFSINGNNYVTTVQTKSNESTKSSLSAQSEEVFGNLKILSKLSKRGEELMQKIHLDTIDFILFDLKPVNYEKYMQIYGNMNCTQSYTQTHENRMNVDCQTDDYHTRSIWTQHHAQFDLNFMQNYNNLKSSQNCCGEFYNDGLDKENMAQNSNTDLLTESLRKLQNFHRQETIRNRQHESIQKPLINFDQLNIFLNRTAFTLSGILSKSRYHDNQDKKSQKDFKRGFDNISKGYVTLNTNFLNALKVIKIFANSNLNLILTVHESIDQGVYENEFLNLISVWSVSDIEKPIRLLSVWSEVCGIDICEENPDIIVCGLRDGSIAMWDLRETYSFCSKLDGYLKHFPATQSIAPSVMENIDSGNQLIDLGPVINVKCFRKSSVSMNKLKSHKSIQFASLNDTGIVTVWTLIETSQTSFQSLGATAKNFETFHHNKVQLMNTKLEYMSPWARIKLVQSELCDLRDYLKMKKLRPKSGFEKTKSYFENELFNDEALKELQETKIDNNFENLQGLRFTNLDTSSERIFIGTNRNFLISCTRTLRFDQFHKITFDETKFLFSTAFHVLKFSEFLIIGLSNGSVIVIDCNLSKHQFDICNSNDDDENKSIECSDGAKSLENEFNNGKSCAIQNIIRNERKMIENRNLDGLDNFHDKTEQKYDTKQISLDEFMYLNLYDQQILLDGSILRKNLVQTIEISTDGRKMLVLSDGNIRVYDFINERATSECGEGDIFDLFTVKSVISNEQNFVILTKDNCVQIHNLK